MEKQKKEQEETKILMNSNPNDKEAQKKIEEIIKQRNIDENLKMAQEYIPESFHRIHMLYIHININKVDLIALVDTGAQSTIMGLECAKKTGLYNMIDTRFHGTAVGVGTSKIIGVIHAAQLKINNRFLVCKITVIENSSIDCIFGLDNMRSHRCTLELKTNQIIFPDADIKVSFLSDGEIEKLKIDIQKQNSELEDYAEN